MTAFLLITIAILLLIGVPIGIALGAGSLLTILKSGAFNSLIISQKILKGAGSFGLLAIPLFTLAGDVMTRGGVSDKLIYLANKVVGRFKGGLAMVTTLACAFFGAISGSSPATTSAIGGLMIPQMVKSGYDRDFSAATVAASGLLGIIIPPSTTMLMYALIADVSIAKMFLGGFIPGIIMAVSLMIVEYVVAKKRNYGSSQFELEEFKGQKKGVILFQSFLALLSPFIILGGIYGGIFTATEAAGVSVAYGALVGYFIFKRLSLRQFFRSCIETGVSTSVILFLIGAAAAFGWLLTVLQLPTLLTNTIRSITDSPAVVLLMCNIALLIAGALLDNAAAITLLTPVLVPLVKSYGIDTTFFGLIMIINLSIGQITPPIGMNLFVSANISGVRIEKIVRQVVPFILVLLVDLFVFTYVPGIVTFLPNLLMK